MTKTSTTPLLCKIAKRLSIPSTQLEDWQRSKKISIRPLDSGWRLVILGEPARTEITAAYFKRARPVLPEWE